MTMASRSRSRLFCERSRNGDTYRVAWLRPRPLLLLFRPEFPVDYYTRRKYSSTSLKSRQSARRFPVERQCVKRHAPLSRRRRRQLRSPVLRCECASLSVDTLRHATWRPCSLYRDASSCAVVCLVLLHHSRASQEKYKFDGEERKK